MIGVQNNRKCRKKHKTMTEQGEREMVDGEGIYLGKTEQMVRTGKRKPQPLVTFCAHAYLSISPTARWMALHIRYSGNKENQRDSIFAWVRSLVQELDPTCRNQLRVHMSKRKILCASTKTGAPKYENK